MTPTRLSLHSEARQVRKEQRSSVTQQHMPNPCIFVEDPSRVGGGCSVQFRAPQPPWHGRGGPDILSSGGILNSLFHSEHFE